MNGPLYIKNFKCIADACRHSCCIGWEIDIDEVTLAKYKACDTERGTRICEGVSVGEDGEACFRMCEDGRCPQLDGDGLCEIIKDLGEEYLSDICREHPRFYHECGGVREVGIGLCCEAAAELILTSDEWGEIVPIGECDTAREDRDFSASVHTPYQDGFNAMCERASLYRILGDRCQGLDERLDRIRKIAGITEDEIRDKITSVLPALEYLDGDYESLLTRSLRLSRSPFFDEYSERALAYFIFRYVSPAENIEDMKSRLRLSLALEQMLACVLDMPTMIDKYGVFECARMCSEEIEYNEDNIDILRFALDN